MTRGLESRWAPAVVFLLTAVFVTRAWGSLREPSFIHDEAAYLLQADIFSSFRLSAEPPPLPEFFEQYHVLVTPRLAPKYPPGHALLLVPGVWLGWPGLGPVLLHGLAAALLFSMARRLAGPWVALLAWLLWLSAPLLNVWRATYLSQSTSTALWMLTAWLLLRWWEKGRPRDLVGSRCAWPGSRSRAPSPPWPSRSRRVSSCSWARGAGARGSPRRRRERGPRRALDPPRLERRGHRRLADAPLHAVRRGLHPLGPPGLRREPRPP